MAQKYESVSYYDLAARRKLNKPEDWRCASILARKGGLLIELRPTHVKARGKNKGQTAWHREKETCILQESEVEAERARFEAETGRCCNCYGNGEAWSGWDSTTGNRYSPCRKCKATGLATNS